MRLSVAKTWTVLVLLAAGVLPAQQHHASPDLTWMRSYSAPYTDAAQSPVKAKIVRQMNGAPEFLPTLHAALPQRQWFWQDHGRFTPLPELAQLFLGVPGPSWDKGSSAWAEDGRFVTEDGCVPHDCGSDGNNGMLWADTAPPTPWVVFVASNPAHVVHGPSVRLWLFTSRNLNFQQVPPALLASLQRWMSENNMFRAEDVLLVTIVQPTGEQIDMDLPSLKAATATGK